MIRVPWRMPVIPATLEAEAEESLERGRGCREPRLHLAYQPGLQSKTSFQTKKKNKENPSCLPGFSLALNSKVPFRQHQRCNDSSKMYTYEETASSFSNTTAEWMLPSDRPM